MMVNRSKKINGLHRWFLYLYGFSVSVEIEDEMEN